VLVAPGSLVCLSVSPPRCSPPSSSLPISWPRKHVWLVWFGHKSRLGYCPGLESSGQVGHRETVLAAYLHTLLSFFPFFIVCVVALAPPFLHPSLLPEKEPAPFVVFPWVPILRHPYPNLLFLVLFSRHF